jgi:hypothetical protein
MCDALLPDTLVNATVSRVCGVNLPLGVKASCTRGVDDAAVEHIVVDDKSVKSHAAVGAPMENPRTAVASSANTVNRAANTFRCEGSILGLTERKDGRSDSGEC